MKENQAQPVVITVIDKKWGEEIIELRISELRLLVATWKATEQDRDDLRLLIG